MTLDELYRNRWSYYVNVIKRHVKSYDIAEDIVQEAFLKCLGKSSYNPKKGPLENWFYSVLRSKLRQYYRDKSKDPTFINIESILDSIFLSVEEKQNLSLIIEESPFSDLHKEIIFDKIIMGHTYQQVADMYGMRQGNIRQIIKRFRCACV